MTRPTSSTALAVLLGSAFATIGHAQGASNITVDGNAAWASLDGIDQYALIRNGYRSIADATYVVDALEDHLSALGRFGYVTRCLDSESVAQSAICQPDIDAFDPAKVLAEIDVDKDHTDGLRAALRAALVAVKPALAEHAAKVKREIGKEDAYKKMFELAASTRKEWAAHKNGELRELALAMDDARTTRSRKALAGCEDKTWAAWKSAVSAIPAKRFSLAYKNMITEVFEPMAATIVGDPNGYLAAIALGACFGEEADMLVKHVQHALLYWPGYRGPRGATNLAILQADLTLDDRDGKIVYPNIDRRALFGRSNGADLSYRGYARARRRDEAERRADARDVRSDQDQGDAVHRLPRRQAPVAHREQRPLGLRGHLLQVRAGRRHQRSAEADRHAEPLRRAGESRHDRDVRRLDAAARGAEPHRDGAVGGVRRVGEIDGRLG